ncbi:DUF5011 domain-containing protein [bacterium]|nr:DUF5011 domain-containing protein [bacterium]
MRSIRSFLLRMEAGRFYFARSIQGLLLLFLIFGPCPSPDGASTNTNSRTKFLINQRPQYAISYNDDTHLANWVSWSLSTNKLGTVQRIDEWAVEELLPLTYYAVGPSSFGTQLGESWDRGHMCPSADRTQSREDNNVTTRMSNIIPQASQNNQGLWANFEGYCRTNLATNNNEVLLISGPANFTGQRLTNQMAVPGSVWKIAVVVTNADSTVPASLRIKANSRVMAINTPNRNTGLGTWQSYLTSVKEIEGITGFNFFSDVDPALATYLKRVVDTGTGPNQPTVITSFSPTSGAAGTTVTIAGYNFGTNPTVRFNGVSASATVSGGTNITAVVPAGAGTGPISVATSSGGTDNSTNSFTFTTSVSPSLTLSLTNLSGFATTWPSASPSQNYLLTGAGLTGNVTVTAPTNFEISLNNTNFASTQSLAPTSGNLSNTVYVRLTASAPAGPVSGVVAHAGGGAASQNLEVSGTVAKATPSLSWSNPTSISYGTVLSATQLNATSSVAGTFSYNPTNGSLLNAGTNTLAAIFRATDSNNYISPVTNTVSLVVTKATPIISNLPTATAITLGQALSNSVLSGGIASVPGNFAFTVPAMVPGATGSQGVTFTPTESGNYNPVTNNVTVVVNALPSSLTLSPATLGIFSATTGTASTNQSYLLSGVGLTNSLNVSTSPGFEISLTNGSGYGSSLDLIPSGGNLGTNTIYVRMASTNAPGVINGTISHNGGGINNQTITLTGVVFATNAAVPITLAKWTFENLSPGTNISSSYGPFSPEEGNHTNLAQFSGFGLHVSTNTAFSRPTGNGSRQSLSCNNWTTNDYFQFTLSSSGYKSLKLKFDQYSSSRGPSQFNLDYSTNGVVFSTYTNYSVPLISSPGFWTNTTVDSRSTLIFDMTSVGEINNKTNLTFRLVQRTTADMSGTSVTSSGTSRVDNVEFSATPLAINYPVLILFGGPTTHITVGGGWSDPGVSALDAEDGNLAVVTNGAVNPNVLGSYLLAYTATDSAGNSSTTNRTVNVLLNSFNSVAADSDENGIPDLVEYALGGLPTGNPISILPSPVTVGTNLRITFLARTNDSSLLIRPVASTNLSDSNSWNTNGVVKTTGVATNNGFELQTWETPVSGAIRKFLKINISR